MVSHSYKPEDAFWGQLGGCLEALQAGTTTIVDHAHISYSPEHSKSYLMLSSLMAFQFADILHRWRRSLRNHLIRYKVHLLLLPYRQDQDLEAIRIRRYSASNLAFRAIDQFMQRWALWQRSCNHGLCIRLLRSPTRGDCRHIRKSSQPGYQDHHFSLRPQYPR
jgi:hypothetical protein